MKHNHASYVTLSVIDPESVTADASNHEFLQGGRGREINYRDQRHSTAPYKCLGKNQPCASCSQFRGRVSDFSYSGLSCLLEQHPATEANDELPEFLFNVGDHVVYSGKAKVTYIKDFHDKSTPDINYIVGIEIFDSIIDTESVIRLLSFHQAIAKIRHSQNPIYLGAVSSEYKDVLSDFNFCVSSLRSQLNSLQPHLESVQGEEREAFEQRILLTAWQGIRERVFEKQRQLDAITMPHYFSEPFRTAHLNYTRQILSPVMTTEPFGFRAFTKPMGYAGDYLLMCLLYDNGWEGSNLFERVLHRYPNEHANGTAVRQRVSYLRAAIESVVDQGPRGHDSRLRVLALASGPAREIREFLSTYDGRRPIDFILIDQDNRSLGFAKSQLAPYVLQHKGRVTVKYYYVAIKHIMKNPEFLKDIGGLDLIYSAGLFDYFWEHKTARALCHNMSEVLVPGGTLLLGNFRYPAENAWLGTYVYDWPLRYRTDAEMLALADGATVSERHLETEETGQQFFLRLTK
jgi:SAM-dependent methyltransferase